MIFRASMSWRRSLNSVQNILCQNNLYTCQFVFLQKVKCTRLPYFPKRWITLFALVHALSPSEPDYKNSGKHKVTEFILNEADDLFNENKYEEVIRLLQPYKGQKSPEVLWRLSRALYSMSKEAKNDTLHHKLIFEGYELITEALSIDNENFAIHKWYSIFLDARMSLDGITSRINHLVNVKNHMLKANELNPKDATTLHMLGFWCFMIAEMPWYQRKIASTLFATPPTSTYEEALEFFGKAEDVDPNFYSQNLLMLGKTYLRLNKVEKASYYLSKASTYPARTDDDQQANKEAAKLLEKIKIK